LVVISAEKTKGSMLFGDHKSSVEFRMRAEDLLNYLCQVPSTANDYSFATGLTALSFNTLYWYRHLCVVCVVCVGLIVTCCIFTGK
jgi:aminopeptidase-like protein